VVVYGSPYDEGKSEFIDELHRVLSTWQGPTILGVILICVDFLLIKVMVELIKND
jgi:hypothetical protein